MNTSVVPLEKQAFNSKGYSLQCLMRETPLNDWFKIPELSDRLSGTLKKNHKIGFKSYSQLQHEAICQTLGWAFEICKSTYVTYNDAVTEGDVHAITETGWHVDRLLNVHIFDEDYFELKYINIQDMEGNITKQGVGLIVRETSISWIGTGNLCFAIIAEYNPKTGWSEAVNPF